jgi:hypothetical protein
MALSLNAYLKIIRVSAVYDLLLTAPFATPWTFALLRDRMSLINQLLGGGALPAFEPLHVLLACLMGTVVLIWSVLRIIEPTVRLGRFDGAGRFLFVTWMGWGVASTGAPVLLLFMIPELAWGVVQWWTVENTETTFRESIAAFP